MQPSTTPVPDHGTGWGLLLLFVGLYGTVGLLGVGTVVAFVIHRLDRRFPRPLEYLLVAVLLGALGFAGFALLVAARAGRYDVVGLLLLVVFLPLAYVTLRRRGTTRRRVAILSSAAMAWSLPFLIGFGVVAFVGTQGDAISPVVTGAVAVVVVVAGTVGIERLPFVSAAEQPRE